MDWANLIFEAIFLGVVVALTYFLRSFFQSKEQREYVLDLVTAAEQIFGSGLGAKKYEYVSKMLDDRWNLSASQKKVLIESAVGTLSDVWAGIDDKEDEYLAEDEDAEAFLEC